MKGMLAAAVTGALALAAGCESVTGRVFDAGLADTAEAAVTVLEDAGATTTSDVSRGVIHARLDYGKPPKYSIVVRLKPVSEARTRVDVKVHTITNDEGQTHERYNNGTAEDVIRAMERYFAGERPRLVLFVRPNELPLRHYQKTKVRR